ncbi:MAG: hypothetical protein KGY76_03125 [Candidatus Thermoplasmatota archaeon]|nr:hypothetical protein [Candidatus Thermoplasmatota archaeon]
MKVLYLSVFEEEEIDLEEGLKEGIEIERLPPDEKEKAVESAEEYDAIIGARIPREFLKKAENLDYFIIPFAGIPPQDKDKLKDFPDLTVVNSHFNSQFVAEHAWTLLLASVKNLIPIHEKLKEGDWTPRYEHRWSRRLIDQTLLILGYGEIGRALGKIGKSFSMDVKAVKRTPEEADVIDEIGTEEKLDEFLPEADFIISTLPETENTKGYLGEEEFDLMKEGVHLVNVGRGPVIDEEALYNALKSGKLGGVGIDVWWNYPPDEESRSDTFPSNYPLNEFDNVIFSPHRGSHVRDRERYRINDLQDILNSLKEGEEVNVVDIDREY